MEGLDLVRVSCHLWPVLTSLQTDLKEKGTVVVVQSWALVDNPLWLEEVLPARKSIKFG